MIDLNKIYNESCLDTLARMPDDFLDCVVTSPPYYGLRDYGHPGQLGLEPTFQEYIAKLINIFREVKRCLKPTGSVWVNLGDSYSGSGKGPEGNLSNGANFRHLETVAKTQDKTLRPKSLMNIPARFAIAMTDELGFIQRNEIIWQKPSCMPFSGKDRFTVDFEPIFFFTKNEKYYFEQQLEPTLTFDYSNRDRDTSKLNNTPGRTRMAGLQTNAYEMKNKRTTWSVPFEPSSAEHYASYPTKLIITPILATCPAEICNKCKKPREQVIERTTELSSGSGKSGRVPIGKNSGTAQAESGDYDIRMVPKSIVTFGDKTDCGCDAGFHSGIVYDPFTGTATTQVVAHKLGRAWIGSELSTEYYDIANRRLEPLLAQESLF